MAKEQVHLWKRRNSVGLKEKAWVTWDGWTTYKVQVCVVDGSLLPAEVDEDEEGVYEIAGEANVGQRNPDTQSHEALDETCKTQQINANGS